MAATVCAWCKANSYMAKAGDPKIVKTTRLGSNGHSKYTIQMPFSCNNCSHISIGTAATTGAGTINLSAASVDPWWNEKTVSWTPQNVGGKSFPDVPEHIASAADEAYQCNSISALRAAILLARSVIEATCKDKGVNSGPLAGKIDQMAAAGHIRSFTQDAAHELRHLGNNMAHGDFVEPVDADDADAVLAVMSEILDEVYQGPARVSRMKQKRKNGGSSAPATAAASASGI